MLEQLQREESLPVEDEKAPANAENQEAPVGDRAAVETTAAKAPLVDPSRETETEELEEIEEAPPVADAAQATQSRMQKQKRRMQSRYSVMRNRPHRKGSERLQQKKPKHRVRKHLHRSRRPPEKKSSCRSEYLNSRQPSVCAA